MNDAETMKKIGAALARGLIDQGKMIEAGWSTFAINTFSEDVSDDTLAQMKITFMAGADHMFLMLMSLAETGEELTEEDMDYIEAIQEEMEAYRTLFLGSKHSGH